MTKKILVAEDDKFLGNAYRVKLTKASYEVKVVSDGQEALDEMSRVNYDLVILDLVMPKIDGFAVLQEAKKNESLAKIPILVASNLGQKEDIDRALALGANDYIVKTDFSMSKLLEKIKALIGI